jgi:hypothetical protein
MSTKLDLKTPAYPIVFFTKNAAGRHTALCKKGIVTTKYVQLDSGEKLYGTDIQNYWHGDTILMYVEGNQLIPLKRQKSFAVSKISSLLTGGLASTKKLLTEAIANAEAVVQMLQDGKIEFESAKAAADRVFGTELKEIMTVKTSSTFPIMDVNTLHGETNFMKTLIVKTPNGDKKEIVATVDSGAQIGLTSEDFARKYGRSLQKKVNLRGVANSLVPADVFTFHLTDPMYKRSVEMEAAIFPPVKELLHNELVLDAPALKQILPADHKDWYK